MQITRIDVYQAQYRLKDARVHAWSGGKSVSVFDSTIVQSRDR